MAGAKSKPEEKPEPPSEPDRELTPEEEVLARRYLRLLALHIDPPDALRLIEIPDVAHEAERLYEAGCPPKLIYEILSK